MAQPLLTISSNANVIQNKIGQFQSRLPRTVEIQTRELAEIMAEEVRNSISLKFDAGPDSKLKNSIEVIEHQFSSGSSGYAVISTARNPRTGVNYGAWHNYSSAGHYVKPEPDKPRLYQWARENMDNYTDNFPPIYVRPRPFAKSAAQKGVQRIKTVLSKGGKIGDVMQQYFGQG